MPIDGLDETTIEHEGREGKPKATLDAVPVALDGIEDESIRLKTAP